MAAVVMVAMLGSIQHPTEAQGQAVTEDLNADSAVAPVADSAADPAARKVICTAPERIALGIFPRRLDLAVSPTTIETGLNCGMTEMCGIDPCLCGYPDSYGACACNGLEKTRVTLAIQSDSPATVGVLRLGDACWLVPLASGDATIRVAASLPHYEGALVVIVASVDAPVFPLLIPILIVLAVVGSVVAVVRAWARRATKRKTGDGTDEGETPCASSEAGSDALSDTSDEPDDGLPCGSSSGKTAVRTIVPLLLALCLLITGIPSVSCTSSIEVTDNSPRLVSSSVVSMGDGSEAAQRVVIHLVFDKPLVLDGDALSGLEVKLNGEAIDDKSITISVELEADDTLSVILSPALHAGTTTSPHYFAVYEGLLFIGSREANGGLACVRTAGDSDSADSELNAVMSSPTELIIPSGLIIEVAERIAGDSATDTPASATFRVVQVPKIRAVSWLEMEPGGKRALIHNHEFATFSDDAAGRERYAAFMVDSLRRAFGSDCVIAQTGDTVSVVAQEISDGQVISPAVVEGVM
jgi:hypothetical protein